MVDPPYIVVQKPRAMTTAALRGAYDAANRLIGGGVPAVAAPFRVAPMAVGNTQPLQIVDAAGINITFLVANTKENADFAAGVLATFAVHCWVMDSKAAAIYR